MFDLGIAPAHTNKRAKYYLRGATAISVLLNKLSNGFLVTEHPPSPRETSQHHTEVARGKGGTDDDLKKTSIHPVFYHRLFCTQSHGNAGADPS